MEDTSNIDMEATGGNVFNIDELLRITAVPSVPHLVPMTMTDLNSNPASPMSSVLNPLSPIYQQPHTPGQPQTPNQVPPTSDTCASLNTGQKTSPKKIKSLDTIVNELNIKKMKMGDSVIKELIEGVGENVKTFKYAGNYDQVTKIISQSKGGIILKYEHGALKVFRLCQCWVFVASYGSQVCKQKVPRSLSDSGPMPLEVFNFYTFVNRFQKNQVSSHVTTLRFGSPNCDYVEVRVTPMYGPQIKRNLAAKPEDNLDTISSITRSIDQMSMNTLDS